MTIRNWSGISVSRGYWEAVEHQAQLLFERWQRGFREHRLGETDNPQFGKDVGVRLGQLTRGMLTPPYENSDD